MINKRHHTQRFCLGGNTGNDHTDRQTGGQAGGRLGCLTFVKMFLTLVLFSPVKYPEKNRVQRPDSPVISIIGKYKASELLQQVSNTQECACIL